MERFAIGIDIGGSSAKLALVAHGSRVVARSSVPSDPREPWEDAAERIAAAAATLARSRTVAGVGIGCAGCIDPAHGVVRFSPNLPRWRGVPLRRFMEGRLRARCVLDNDVNMMALGEFRYGAARGARNVCCVTIGTGVGGGLILEGRIYRGAAWSAGEVGHVTVEPDGVRCGCGNRGCLERYVARDGLIRLARIAMRGRDSSLRGLKILTPLIIEENARRGDRAAKEAWENAGRYLGIAFAGLANLLNPDIIVVGGGIAKAGRLLLEPARRVFRERALPVPAAHARIVRSRLGSDAGVIGAASEVLEG